MSRMTAPVGELMTATRWGRPAGLLAPVAEEALGLQLALELFKLHLQGAQALQPMRSHINW